MISRSETARPLLTPGEVMQLRPTDEIVMVSGVHPIRAKKARYYEDARFYERILPPPALASPRAVQPDDWSARPFPPRPVSDVWSETNDQNDDENPRAADRRLQPEFDQLKPIEKKQPLDNEFSTDTREDAGAGSLRARRMSDLMLGATHRASLDRGDGLGM